MDTGQKANNTAVICFAVPWEEMLFCRFKCKFPPFPQLSHLPLRLLSGRPGPSEMRK